LNSTKATDGSPAFEDSPHKGKSADEGKIAPRAKVWPLNAPGAEQGHLGRCPSVWYF